MFDADEIVVDGTKIKASAGKSSYKRALRLDEAEAAARTRVAALKAEVDADPAASSRRTQAARARGLRQTQERIEKARGKLAEIEAEKAKRAERSPKEVAEQKEARASLTDPQARRMRCPDGAVRASYNVQIAATTDHGFVTAIMATDRRNESGLVRPMLEESEQRLGRPIKRVWRTNAGTHTPCPLGKCTGVRYLARQQRPRSMGPGVRRDDGLRESGALRHHQRIHNRHALPLRVHQHRIELDL